MITAKEALERSKNHKELKEIESKILAAVDRGERDVFFTSDICISPQSPISEVCVKLLREKGFKVSESKDDYSSSTRVQRCRNIQIKW